MVGLLVPFGLRQNVAISKVCIVMLRSRVYIENFCCVSLVYSPDLCSYTNFFTSPTTSPRQSQETYDYIVIGSGPGGGPLSARLAIAGYKVLLIEAGDDQGSNPRYQVPALHTQSTEDSSMRWDYYVNHYSDMERQKRDSKMTYRTPSGSLHVGPNVVTGTGQPPPGSKELGILYPRAGTLGGCSSHNALITIYPHKSDWNNIASLTGDASWAADKMRGYFKRMEKSRYLPNGIAGHGYTGWLSVMVTDLTLLLEDLKLVSLIVAAATGMGKTILGGLIRTVTGLASVLLLDINADTPGRDSAEGLYQVPITIDNYARTGSREFILSTANAKNSDGSRKYHLDIRLNTLATKVLFDETVSPPRATGVEYLSGKSIYRADPRASVASSGTKGTVTAKREIIISAGSFNTPQLLMLSGIGPSSELRKHNIPLLVHSPGVGTNLQDRYEASLGGSHSSDFSILKDCTFLLSTPDPCFERWRQNPVLKGVYGSNGLSVGIVKKSSVAEGDADLFIAGAPAYFTGYYQGYANASLAEKNKWVWIVLKAHSRNNAGVVSLKSKDPRDTPVINFNNFAVGGEKDIQAITEGLDFGRRAFKSVLPLTGGRWKEVWPGADVKGGDLKEWIRDEAWGHHACCTAKIGADGDENAVLDSRFRVRGVQGLRVVDASVFPKIPGFYIAVPVYMVGEKAADVILEDAKLN